MTKSFVPLECNPEVFGGLLEAWGVSKGSFHDVFSIDEPEMLAFIPRPVAALILVFPISKEYEAYREKADATAAAYDPTTGRAEGANWWPQTITNACGTMALLHAVANGLPASSVPENSLIGQIIAQSNDLNTNDARAKLLEDSQPFEAAHASVCDEGETDAPAADDPIDFHYVALVRSQNNGHLYELDGRRKGPIDLGQLKEGEDALSQLSLDKVREFMEREKESGGYFSIIALSED